MDTECQTACDMATAFRLPSGADSCPCRMRDGVRPCENACPIVEARGADSAQATEHLALGGARPRKVVITSAPAVDGRQVQVIRDETELESARSARDSVLANISHEFRTPLGAQLASIELLRDGLEPFAEFDALHV